jgi:hypothetical protein
MDGIGNPSAVGERSASPAVVRDSRTTFVLPHAVTVEAFALMEQKAAKLI